MDICDHLVNATSFKSVNLPFPTDVLKWMKVNAKPHNSLKLMQVCKYFKHQKFPYFVVTKIFGDEEFWKYHTLDGEAHDSFDDVPDSLWITEALTIMYSKEKIISRLLLKVVVCDIKILNICEQDCVGFNEFKFLTASGKVEIFTLASTIIFNANGKHASLQELFECLPNVKTMEIYGEVPPQLSATNDKIFPPPKLEILDLRGIIEMTMDFNRFTDFMIENQRIKYNLSFDESVSFDYCRKLQVNVEKMDDAWSSENQFPEIRCPFKPESLTAGNPYDE